MDFVEQELLEFSVVPVPANPEALTITQRALAKWLHTSDLLDVTEADIREVLPGAIRDALTSVVRDLSPIIARETKNAIDRSRGRIVDDDYAVEIVDPLGDRSVHHKHGRVLSGANERRVRRARAMAQKCDSHLRDVLASMGDGDENVIELDD